MNSHGQLTPHNVCKTWSPVSWLQTCLAQRVSIGKTAQLTHYCSACTVQCAGTGLALLSSPHNRQGINNRQPQPGIIRASVMIYCSDYPGPSTTDAELRSQVHNIINWWIIITPGWARLAWATQPDPIHWFREILLPWINSGWAVKILWKGSKSHQKFSEVKCGFEGWELGSFPQWPSVAGRGRGDLAER